MAGSARMRHPVFLGFNAAGGLVWGTGLVLLGFLAGNSYQQVEKAVGRTAATIVVALLIAFLVVWRVRKHRAKTREESQQDR